VAEKEKAAGGLNPCYKHNTWQRPGLCTCEIPGGITMNEKKFDQAIELIKLASLYNKSGRKKTAREHVFKAIEILTEEAAA
jgi:hypothetical protein